MLTGLLDFIRTLTDPKGLIQLLSTVFTGWWGYGMLCGIVFSETGCSSVFFCRVTRCCSRSALCAAQIN
jgi:hypothetical protein